MERAGRINSGGRESKKSLSPGKDDSLLDFKSPKQEPVAPVRVKVVSDKRGKKSSSKGRTSAHKKKEVAVKEVSQPSIESSFFKAAINSKRDGHTCPLCMKYFADTSAGTLHTKSCAAKNKVSTKTLLAAVALQERQANERAAIGLPAGPIAQPKDKAPRRPRELVAKGDSDLQLALALSKSLQEKQLEQEFEEALLLAGEHRGDGQIVGFSSESDRKSTLKNFGFLTNKAIGAFVGPRRTRRKKHQGPTILQTRSQEARDRLLTERIAEVLMGDERITQVCREESVVEVHSVKKQPVVLRSHRLKEIYRTTDRLWDTAQLPSTGTNFYVEDLSPVIMPTVVQKEENSGNPDEGSNNAEEDTDRIKKEAPHTVFEESPPDEDDRLTEKLSESSEELEQINKLANNRSESPRLNDIHVTDRQYRNTLSMDWASTLNVSSMSDVIVLVQNGHIWAHKLVFHVRCSDILLDCEPNSDAKFSHVREKICWPDVDLSTGLAFLEFVYSGLIEKHTGIFSDERLASGVRRLARKYRLKVLFDYLRRKQAESDRLKTAAESARGRKSGLGTPVIIEVNRTPSETETAQGSLPTTVESQDTEDDSQSSRSSPSRARVDSPSVEVTNSTEQTAESDSQSHIDAKSVISVASSCGSMSPDLFDETTEEASADTAKASENCGEIAEETNNDNSNLKVLADLVARGDLSSSGHSTASTIVHDALSTKSPSGDEANEFSSLSQSHTETPRSRSSATVDEAAKINDKPRSQRFQEKPKSNLSLFIEKMEKINAKGPFDSYTDDESLAQPLPLYRRRNPFKIDSTTDTFLLDSHEKLKLKRKRCREKKRGLSVFNQLEATSSTKEDNDESKLADDSADANETPPVEESSKVDDTAKTDDEDISMYSKYRKTHKHNNSISNYRKMLEKMVNPNTASEDENSDKLSSVNDDAIDLTQETNSEVDTPPSPMSGASNSRDRGNLANASDDESIRTESTAIVHSNASDNDEKRKNADIGQTASATSSNAVKSDEGKAMRSNSVVDLDKSEENAPYVVVNTTPVSVRSSRNSSPHSLRNLLDDDEEIFAHSWKSNARSPSPSSGRSLTPERKRKSEERAKDSSIDDLQKDKKAWRYRSSNSKKSSKNKTRSPSPRTSPPSGQSLTPERKRKSEERAKDSSIDDLQKDEEAWPYRSPNSKKSSKNKMRSPSPKTSPSSGQSLTPECKRKSEERAKDSSIDDLQKDEEAWRYRSSNSKKSSTNSSRQLSCNLLDADAEIFVPSWKNKTRSPSPSASIGQAASATSSSGVKSDEGKAKRSNSVVDLDKSEENAPYVVVNRTPVSVRSSRNSSPHSLRNLLDDDEEIFAHSWKSNARSSSPSSGRPLTPERKRKSEERAKDSSIDDLPKDEEAWRYRSSNNKKSSRNSSRQLSCNLLNADDEIFVHSWTNKTRSPSPSSSSSSESLPAKRKRTSKERTKRNDCDDDLQKDEKAARCSATNKSSKAKNSLRSPSDYPDLDVFEINEEMFAHGQRSSFTPSPKSRYDYSARSSSSRRKRRAEGSRTKHRSFDDSLIRKSPADISKYPDVDVDELLTQSLRNKNEMPCSSPTPVENDSSDSPENPSSSSRKRTSSRKTTRGSSANNSGDNKMNKSLEDVNNSSQYQYEVFEPDNHVFTQSFGSPRLSPHRSLSRSPNSVPSNKISDRGSTLKIPSPIVISSSPEIDVGIESNVSSYERDCDKENRLTTHRRSPLTFSRNLESIAEAMTPTNHERSTLLSRERREDPAEAFSPRNLERATTPQPGTSRNYSNSNRGNLSSSAKSPLVRWNSMPASSSNGELQRKRSRTPKKSSRLVASQDVTPPVNYDVMGTPELKEELAKYGIKPQRRNRARQLLKYIYNELHPVVPASSLENDSDDFMPLGDDYEPPAKKVGKPSSRTSDDSDSDREIPLSQQSNTNAASIIPEEMDFADGNASPDDCADSASTNNIKKAFAALIKDDRELHNKILIYEPLPLELLHLMLKARGLKCKCKDLMDFLDEECITFQVQSQRTRSNKTRGKKTTRSGKGKANSQKS